MRNTSIRAEKPCRTSGSALVPEPETYAAAEAGDRIIEDDRRCDACEPRLCEEVSERQDLLFPFGDLGRLVASPKGLATVGQPLSADELDPEFGRAECLALIREQHLELLVDELVASSLGEFSDCTTQSRELPAEHPQSVGLLGAFNLSLNRGPRLAQLPRSDQVSQLASPLLERLRSVLGLRPQVGDLLGENHEGAIEGTFGGGCDFAFAAV